MTDDSQLLESRHAAALEFLLGRINYERTPLPPYGQRQLKLDRMRQLLTRLGNPDAGMPIVHVAGTKGKGSTSALIASILHAAGYEVGLYSSPHLERIEERFAVNGHACSAEEFTGLVDRLRPIVTAMDEEAAQVGASAVEYSLSPTYFELTTAMALMHFAQRPVDVAVLEVGLGGRLDSTNVCQPAVTVISSISFDHTKQLGDTLAKIAAEKAGIIKPGVPVLCGPLNEEPRQVIAEIAQQHGCRLIESGRDFGYTYRAPLQVGPHSEFGSLDFFDIGPDQRTEYSNLPLRLLGQHQAANAALAVATCLELQRQGWSIAQEAIQLGLANLTIPARIEVVRHDPTVILDVAHNVASIEALVNVLAECFTSKQRILVLAISKDKDVRGIVRTLLPHFERVIVTEYQENPRAVPFAELAQIVEQELLATPSALSVELSACATPDQAWQLAQQAAAACTAEQPLICITGSFFIAAELRRASSADA